MTPRGWRGRLDRVSVAGWYIALRVRLARAYRHSSLHQTLSVAEGVPSRRPVAILEVERGIALGEVLLKRQHLTPDSCLYRALARYAVLRAHGHPVTFVMGVRETDATDGHAWVEAEGEPILEREPPDFLVTYSHPKAA